MRQAEAWCFNPAPDSNTPLNHLLHTLTLLLTFETIGSKSRKLMKLLHSP